MKSSKYNIYPSIVIFLMMLFYNIPITNAQLKYSQDKFDNLLQNSDLPFEITDEDLNYMGYFSATLTDYFKRSLEPNIITAEMFLSGIDRQGIFDERSVAYFKSQLNINNVNLLDYPDINPNYLYQEIEFALFQASLYTVLKVGLTKFKKDTLLLIKTYER
jgi:hypothetical protein